MKKVRRFNGEEGSEVSDETLNKLRQDQLERMARLADESVDSSRVLETPTEAPASRSMASAAPVAARPVAAAPKAKPAIVTLQQLNAFKAKYGADKELRDYMNAQQGNLKRRNAPPPSAPSAPPPSVSGKRETTTEDVFPVLTGEKKRAEEKMDKKQAKAEANAQLIAKVKAGKDPRAILYPYSSTPGIEHAKAKEPEKRTPKRSGNLTDMLGISSRFAKGGSVSSRADGIAQRGKTRGRMC